jgi:tetratricopeptide (TPR) repeat protein
MSSHSAIAVCVLTFVTLLFSSACSYQKTSAEQTAPTVTMTGDAEIDEALKVIDKMPDSPPAYNQLALVYIKRGRETGDFAFNAKAEAAVEKALQAAPNDAMARKLQASLHMTYHRFDQALDAGKQLEKEFPKDPYVYGILADAHIELGNYPEAIAAVQKMVDLKPGAASYFRVGRLRSLHGDQAGAVEMMTQSARIADPLNKEEKSWYTVQLGDEYWRRGKFAEAEKVYNESLAAFPDYHLALAAMGKFKASVGDLDGAIKYLSEAQNRIPNTETTIMLGDVYGRKGDTENAKKQYDLVEVIEGKFGMKGDQKRLALFWADRGERLDEALKIATEEHALRKDIYTADVLAWCLYKKGDLTSAKKIIAEAMRLKTDDARILYHAGMIERDLGNESEAKRLIAAALKSNPAFDPIQAANAATALSGLGA